MSCNNVRYTAGNRCSTVFCPQWWWYWATLQHIKRQNDSALFRTNRPESNFIQLRQTWNYVLCPTISILFNFNLPYTPLRPASNDFFCLFLYFKTVLTGFRFHFIICVYQDKLKITVNNKKKKTDKKKVQYSENPGTVNVQHLEAYLYPAKILTS